MRKYFLGVLIVLLFCSHALAEKTIVSEFDGSDWQGWTEAKKFNFLSGFLLGTSYMVKKNEPLMPKDYRSQKFDDMRKRLSMGQEKKKKQTQNFNKEDVVLWGHYRAAMIQSGLIDFAVYEITVSQLSKSMDDLYKDSRNMKIRIADAVYAAKKQIKGTGREEMENMLMYLRGD